MSATLPPSSLTNPPTSAELSVEWTGGAAQAAGREVATSDLLAADVMTTSLLVMRADDSVLLAWELMAQAGVHHVPVMDDGQLLQVVDDRALAREWANGPLTGDRHVLRHIARGVLVRVRPTDPLPAVANVMDRHDIDAVAVTDDSGYLLGLITSRDLVRALSDPRACLERARSQEAHSEPVLFRLDPALPPMVPRHHW